MPEQQWSERTLDMPPQDPWADAEAEPPTVPPTRPTAPVTSAPTHPRTARLPAAHQHDQHAHDPQETRVQDPRAQHPTHPVTPPPAQSPFSRGRAQVTPRTEQFVAEHEPTGTGWPGAGVPPRPQHSVGWHLRRLRRGGEWSSAAALFAFVCWGIWAISSDAPLVNSSIVFLVALLVAVGVFALSRLVGRLVLEQRLGRTRHTARGAHLVAALFLAGVGVAHLRQTGWVMDAVRWVTGQVS